MFLLVVLQHGEESNLVPLEELEVLSRPEAPIKAQPGQSKAQVMDGLYLPAAGRRQESIECVGDYGGINHL